MKRMSAVTLSMIGLMGTGVSAQALPALGDSVQVTYAETEGVTPRSVAGLFHGVRTDSVAVLGGVRGDTLRIPLHFVRTLGVYRTSHQGGGFAVLGAVVGGALGVVEAKNQEKCGDSCLVFSDEQSAALSVVGGVLAGALLGYFVGRTMRTVDKTEVPVTDLAEWSLTPTVRNGIGLSASIRTN